jgi:hypothetical protein
MTRRASHLTEAELVDLLDGTLDDERRRHVDGCDQCAAQAAALGAGAEAANEGDVGDVPEPSPFFWAQFTARVSEAVANEAAKPRIAAFGWARAPWMGAAAAAAVMVIWLFLPLTNRTPAPSTNNGIETAATAHADPIDGDGALDLDSDEAWALVRSLAEDLDEDQMDAEGLSLGAGAAEHLALQLTDAERTELARLLQEQLRRGRATESVS